MEVDVVCGVAVHAGLGDGEGLEGAQRQGPHGVGDLGALEHRADVAPVAVGVVVHEHFDVDLARPQPGSHHLSGPESNGVRKDGIDHGLHGLQVRAEIHQGAEQHVAGDPGTRVDPCVPPRR